MATGRPTSYSEEMLEKTKHYIDHYEEYDDVIPSIAGLACILGVNRSTIYEWDDNPDYKEFSNTLGMLLAKQEKVALNNGLNSTFNAAITKLVLHNHGYADKQDLGISDARNITPWDQVTAGEDE